MTDAHPSVTALVPVFNEAEALPQAVAELQAAFDRLPNRGEILIVESGSVDGSDQVADTLAERHPNVVVLHEKQRNGFGSALRLGFAAATGDWVCVVPADLPYDLAVIEQALGLAPECEAVLSKRRHDQRSAFRKLQSQVYATLCWLLLGLPRLSPNAAFKMYRRDLVADLKLTSSGWFIDTESVYRLHRMKVRVRTVEIDVYERKFGTSTVTLVDVGRIMLCLFAFRWRVLFERRND